MTDKLVFQITADTKQAEQALSALLTGFKSLKAGSDLSQVGAGGSSALSTVLKLTAAVGGLAAAVAGVQGAFSKGLGANAAAETSQLGLKTLIASLYVVKDANGQVLQGAEALSAAGTIAAKQLDALRLAGMNTSAEFQDLATAFNTALGTGASAGLTVDQIRETTVKLVQAAGVFNVQKDQLSSEIRAILSGDELDNSEIAKGLSITGAQIKLWREQGTLVDELNKRLEMVALAGDEAGKTWDATLSNLNDGFTLLLRETTAGAFDNIKSSLQKAITAGIDPATGAIKQELIGVADFANDVFSGIGDTLADAIDTAVELTKELSSWLSENSIIVDQTLASFGNLVGVIGDAVGQAAALVGELGGAAASSGFLKNVLDGVALAIALATDGAKLFGGVIAGLGAGIVAALLTPLQWVAKLIDKIAGTDLEAAAGRVQKMAMNAMKSATKVAEAGLALETVRKTGEKIAAQKIVLPDVKGPARKTTSTAGVSLGVKNRPTAPASDRGKAEADTARKDAAALESLQNALAEQAAKRAKTQRATALAQLDADLQKQLLTQVDYLNKKAALDNAALEDEKAAKQARIAQLNASLSAEKTTQADRLKVQAEVTKLSADIEELDGKKAVIAIELDKNTGEVSRYLADLKRDLEAGLLEITGKGADAQRARLKVETEKMLADPRVKGNAGIEELIRNTEAAKFQLIAFDEAARKLAELKSEFSLVERSIQRDQETGAITAKEAEAQLYEEKQRTLEAMREQIAALEELAAASGNEAQLAQVRQLKEEYADTAAVVNEVAKDINDAFYGSLQSNLKDAITGVKSWGDAAKSVIADVLSKLAEAQFTQFINSALGGATGGLGGALSSFMPRLAGGQVSAGGAYMVGERGPEQFFPGISGTVVPTARIQAVLADMLGMRARTAPTAGGFASALPQFSAGDTSVSVSPKLVLSTKDLASALRETPEFENIITVLAQRNYSRIKGGR